MSAWKSIKSMVIWWVNPERSEADDRFMYGFSESEALELVAERATATPSGSPASDHEPGPPANAAPGAIAVQGPWAFGMHRDAIPDDLAPPA